jgi:hypothetical protein
VEERSHRPVAATLHGAIHRSSKRAASPADGAFLEFSRGHFSRSRKHFGVGRTLIQRAVIRANRSRKSPSNTNRPLEKCFD